MELWIVLVGKYCWFIGEQSCPGLCKSVGDRGHHPHPSYYNSSAHYQQLKQNMNIFIFCLCQIYIWLVWINFLNQQFSNNGTKRQNSKKFNEGYNKLIQVQQYNRQNIKAQRRNNKMGSVFNKKQTNQSQQFLIEAINRENSQSVQQEQQLPKLFRELSKHKSRTMRPQPKLQKQMQLDSRTHQIKQQWYKKVYFTPESKFILVFKTITLILIYVYFLEIPITIAFEKHRNEDESQKFFEMINIPAIIIFVTGIFIKLKTGFYKEGILIQEQDKIIKNYLVYSFVFDFFSIISIIIYEFSEIIRDKSTDPNPIGYRYIVLLFYLKVPQVFRIQGSIISSFDLNRRIKAFFKLLLLMTKIFMLCNIAACCFFYISDNVCPMQQCQDCCWIYQLQIMGDSLKNAEWVVQYAFSLYWASTTMLTIGYGDITPQNLSQAVYTVSAQFISCVLFAFSINEIWSIIQQKNAKRFKIHSRLNIINVYMRDKNVGSQLKSRVNAYLSHFYHTKNLREKQLQNQIMSELTPSLRKQLFFESYGFLFHTHSFFSTFSEYFLQHVSQYIREIGFFEEQVVFGPQIKENLSLYYVHKGELQSYIELGNTRTKNIKLLDLQKGCIVGLYEFVRQINYCSSLIAKKYSLLYVLDYQNWIQCAREYDQDYEKFFLAKHNTLYERKVKKLNLQCKLCGSKKHQSDYCLQDQIESKNQSFLNKYLDKAERVPYNRRTFKIGLDVKSQPFMIQPTSPKRMQRLRKNSGVLRRQSLKNQSNKKSIFHKKSHNEKMTKIIEKKMNQSVWQSESSSDDEIVSDMVTIDSVQIYQTYWPVMNANNTDWGKQRRRLTLNRMFKN